MARRPPNEPVYKATQEFLSRCLVEDGSLIWPERKAWSLENVSEVKKRLVDTPNTRSDLSFEQKLLEQMAGARPEQWMILADTYYVYFLPSTFITSSKKLGDIRSAAKQGGLTVPADGDAIWVPLRAGFCHTALKYHYKVAQFRLVILLAKRVKTDANPRGLLDDPNRLQETLDEILNEIPNGVDRAYDMRHALLYMAFPDQYERIISTRDKERIVGTYRNRIPGTVPTDLDEAIRKIRTALTADLDKTSSFDFYDDVRAEWRGGKVDKSPIPIVTTSAEGSGVETGSTVSTPDEDVATVLEVLKHTHNVILCGPPGTGKTYIAKKAAASLVKAQVRSDLSTEARTAKAIEDLTTAVPEDFTDWVTFHQSYSYEDFVEGLRPVKAEAGDERDGLSYDVVAGIFRRVCKRATKDPASKYVLVIDEINRGNVAKILGELITLLEDDKRLGQANTLTVTLPYSGDRFAVPNNLYVIGTMNTSDRSIALFDTALRRRFAFVELMPRPELLGDAKVESTEGTVPLGSLLQSLNTRITRQLGRERQIGHSYFLTVAQSQEGERLEMLEFVWNHQIVPLLEEYYYSQRDKLAELLAPFVTDVESSADADTDEGTVFEVGMQTGGDLLAALARLAGSQQPGGPMVPLQASALLGQSGG